MMLDGTRQETPVTTTQYASLDRLFRPQSIALVGASPDPRKISGRPIQFLRAMGYRGRIFPVNPKYETMYDLPAFPSVADLPEPADLALITTPASTTESVITACAEAGIRSAILYTAGFGEFSKEGAEAERRVGAIAREAGIRILGPNCQGFVNIVDSISTTFNAAFSRPAGIKPGNVAWVSQSGALGGMAFDLMRKAGVQVNFWVSTGNEIDVTVSECMRFFLEDESTAMVCGYLEAIGDPTAFRAMAARAVELGKPVVLIKGGMTSAGATATATHTGSLAGEAAVYRALFKQTGVILVDDLHDMAAFATLGSVGRRFRGHTRVAIMSNSGGLNAIIADRCSDRGLAVPPIGESATQQIQRLLPPFIRAINPIDFQQEIHADSGRAAQLIDLLRETGDHDVFIVAPHSIYDDLGYDSEGLIDSLAGAQQRGASMILILLNCQEDLIPRARERGLTVFEDVSRAVAALSAIAGPAELARPTRRAAAATSRGSAAGEVAARKMLEKAGVSFARWTFVSTPEEAAAAARDMGGPVVVKVVADGITHKTDIGGVLVGIAGAADAKRAFERVTDAGRAAGATVSGAIIEEMVQGGIEVVVGVRRDPTLGPVVMFGLGGILIELIRDVAFRVAPFDADEARRMLKETKGYARLSGYRGEAPRDVEALVALVLAVAELASSDPAILEIDLNPVMVLPEGGGVQAVDAVVVMASD
jgi:acyl-CoA synthetase (NDP forming)